MGKGGGGAAHARAVAILVLLGAVSDGRASLLQQTSRYEHMRLKSEKRMLMLKTNGSVYSQHSTGLPPGVQASHRLSASTGSHLWVALRHDAVPVGSVSHCSHDCEDQPAQVASTCFHLSRCWGRTGHSY